MGSGWKVIFSLFVALLVVLGFLSFPYLNTLIETCTGSPLCGKSISNSLDYFSQTDSAAVALGHFFYQKLITGVITFLVILVFSTIAHKVYKKLKN